MSAQLMYSQKDAGLLSIQKMSKTLSHQPWLNYIEENYCGKNPGKVAPSMKERRLVGGACWAELIARSGRRSEIHSQRTKED